MNAQWERMRVLITVKTYPIPSAKYDELVCTAGVQQEGAFVRLYPINFRDLPYSQQYRKYQWIEVEAQRHTGRDVRKESYRPNPDTLKLLGEPILTTKGGDWSKRAKYVLARKSRSMEHLYAQQEEDRTSLGIFRPKEVQDLLVTPDEADWKAGFKAALAQARLWEKRAASLEPPRKVPFKFQYKFTCDEPTCKGHRMMIEDWEVGALYWKCIDQGATPNEACQSVRHKFLEEICAAERDTHLYVGTILAYPKSWVVIGVFWPRRALRPLQVALPLLE